MTDKDLRKLSRTELLELLIELSKENGILKDEISERDGRIAELEERLKNRSLLLENAGSIAEASLQLNGVFEAAQLAAEEYLENLRLRFRDQEAYSKRAEEEALQKAETMLRQTEEECRLMKQNAAKQEEATRQKVESMLRQAERHCKLLEEKTTKQCEEMTQKARLESQRYWDQVSVKFGDYVKQRSDSR